MPFPNPDTQFKPGNNANPGGRLKGRSLTSRLREILDATELAGEPLPPGKCVADLVAEVMIRGALRGDLKFIQMVLDRTEGKPKQVTQFQDTSDEDLIRLVTETLGGA